MHFSSCLSSQTVSATWLGVSEHSWVLMVVQAFTESFEHFVVVTVVHLSSSASVQVVFSTSTQISLLSGWQDSTDST